MKIGEWDNLGRARALLQRQLGELRATEYAAHVNVNSDNGRMRVLLATDVGLFDYAYAPGGSDPHADGVLRGQLTRWPSVRGLRVQTDAQLEQGGDVSRSVWRLVAEEPKIELSAASDAGDRSLDAVLDFARACLQHAG